MNYALTLGVLANDRPRAVVSCPVFPPGPVSIRAVMEAISRGAPEAVGQALTKLDKASALRTLSCTVYEGRTVITHSASRGNRDVFNAVLKEMESRLNTEEVKYSVGAGALT